MDTFTILIEVPSGEAHLVNMLGPDPESAAETAATILAEEILGDDFDPADQDWHGSLTLKAWSGLHDDPPPVAPDFQRLPVSRPATC